MRSFTRAIPCLIPLLASGCAGNPEPAPSPEPIELVRVNLAVNRQGRPCLQDYCLDHWPTVAELDRLDYWDCKAYAVAKADRLIRGHGYHAARLEYLLIDGPPLRATHAALLVDGRWVLDMGLRCQVCKLEQFTAGVQVTGRLPVADLPLVMEAQRR